LDALPYPRILIHIYLATLLIAIVLRVIGTFHTITIQCARPTGNVKIPRLLNLLLRFLYLRLQQDFALSLAAHPCFSVASELTIVFFVTHGKTARKKCCHHPKLNDRVDHHCYVWINVEFTITQYQTNEMP